MKQEDKRDSEIRALRDRLSRLSEASFRMNESLDLDTVLQGVLDSARALTEARYGVMTLYDQTGTLQDFLTSGLPAEKAEPAVGHIGRAAVVQVPQSPHQDPCGCRTSTLNMRSIGIHNLRPPEPLSCALWQNVD